MANWFECRVKYDKMLENGMQKKVTEPYLVDALSFTEAEARIIEEVSPFRPEQTVQGNRKKRRPFPYECSVYLGGIFCFGGEAS